MIFAHTICTISLTLNNYASAEKANLKSVINTVAVFVFVYNQCAVSQFLFLNRVQQEDMTQDYLRFTVWLNTELIVFVACIAGNILFLLCRSLCAEKVSLVPNNQRYDESTDYLESQKLWMGIFLSFVCPLVIMLAVKFQIYFTNVSDDDTAQKVVSWMLWMALIQVMGMLYLTTVSLMTPPYTQSDSFTDSWRQYAPLLHGLIASSIFVLIPLIVITTACYQNSVIN